jgi:hypothetical protein
MLLKGQYKSNGISLQTKTVEKYHQARKNPLARSTTALQAKSPRIVSLHVLRRPNGPSWQFAFVADCPSSSAAATWEHWDSAFASSLLFAWSHGRCPRVHLASLVELGIQAPGCRVASLSSEYDRDMN